MATSAALDKQECSGKGEREDGDSRSVAKEHDESTPGTQSRGMVERAIEDPSLLTPKELECLVRVLCAKVTHQAGIAESTADFCIRVSSKPCVGAFAALLMASVSHWFDKQEELLPRRFPPKRDHLEGMAGGEPRFKWTAFVPFLAELVAAMAGAGWNTPGHKSLWCVAELARLLHGCWGIILGDPAYDSLDELKCIQPSLLVAGKTVDSFSAHSVGDLVDLMRGETKNPTFPPGAPKILLELIDVRASRCEMEK